ncbi:reprolysin-like metallopeptidase [Aquimarina algiphila]|uniref:reprolysin-like metallopeptidase n=1 Tax=Aquimarina algiphila TaxID=2047982 RepID=UPI00232F0B66|nr:M57 family metalloprotease [Aquimarina algiphila]
MKNNKLSYLSFLSLLILMLTIGCSKDDDFVGKEVASEPQNDLVLKSIMSWGFPRDIIVDKGAYYLVDDDIVFYKNQEYASKQTASAKQRRHQNLLIINDINIYIHPGMNSDWQNASIDAIYRWNSINSGLNLKITNSITKAHIEIIYDSQDPNVNLGSNTFGRGSWPTVNGLPGKKIWVNPDFDSNQYCNKSITQNMRISNVQHEIGHNLGITHTNSSFGISIPGTPNTDSQSVMNGGAACTIDNFSLGDIKAITYLFPQPGLLEMKSWAHRQGGFWDNQIWLTGDFNGDGKDDFAKVFDDNGLASMDVHVSNGSSFSIYRWATQQGGIYGNEKWVTGDFNGDGKDDIAKAFPDNNYLAYFDVHISNGSSFSLEHWGAKQGGMYGNETWLSGDFNGDGKDDFAKVFQDGNRASFDVHVSNGTSFVIQRWATQQGGMYGNEKWVTGDFNGDGKDDFAKAFPDGNSLAYFDVHVSNGNSFSLEHWGAKQGGMYGNEIWMSGDFDGDGKDDFAKVFQDDSRASFDVHISNGSNFSMQRWETRQGGMYGNENWNTGDFNGDGYDDFIKSFNNAGSANIDVHLKR